MKSDKLGDRLKKMRIENGLTMKEVARLIPVPETTYREWEYGRAIKGEPYVKLAQVFKVSVHELLTGQKSDKHSAAQEINSIKTHLERLESKLESLF